MPTPVVSTGIRGSDAANPSLATGAAKLSATLAGVAAGHTVVVVTSAFRFSTPTGDLVTGVTIGGTAATLAARGSAVQSGTNHRTECCIWLRPNMSSGDAAVVVAVDGTVDINWHADSWAFSASPLDQTATAQHLSPGTPSVPVPATGTTGALAQASQVVIAAAASRYTWTWGGTYGGGGTPPGGYTLLFGITEDSVNQVPFQSAYRSTASTAGVSAGFSVVDGAAVTAGALATFRLQSVQRRLRVRAEAAINGATGITAYAWPGEPDASLARKWTNVAAESSGGVVLLPDPPAAWSTGSTVNVVLYQPAGAQRGTSFVPAIVEEV